MNRDTFLREMKRMADVFGVKENEGRVTAMFDELKAISEQEWQRGVTAVIQNDDKFPSVARLRNACIGYVGQEKYQKQDCSFCDGYGWVHLDAGGYRMAYRSRCSHSKGLSERIQMVPAEEIFPKDLYSS